MIITEITDEALIDKIVEEFFESIDHIIVNENHIYKYPGSESVCLLLNEISCKLGLSLLFYDDGLGIHLRCKNITREVMALDSILKNFRREYLLLT